MENDDQHTLYAEYRPARALYRPEGCIEHAEHCWVEEGPSALTRDVCRACQDAPRTRPITNQLINGWRHGHDIVGR